MTFTYILGAALLAVGIVLFYFSPKPKNLLVSCALSFASVLLIMLGLILLTPLAFSPKGA